MTDDLYSSDEWKAATPKQRQDFIAKVRSTQRIERDRLATESRKQKKSLVTTPKSKKLTKAQKRSAALLHRNPPAKKSNLLAAGIDVTSDAFLSTFEWRRVRMEALKKYGPKCMCCGATPSTGAVMNVDHIKPRKKWPSLALDVNNLQILCHDCNHGKGNWDQTDWRK
jgi:5-methylcytosine-specific restriction endonuclease McrA